jgi:hypothetical protein
MRKLRNITTLMFSFVLMLSIFAITVSADTADVKDANGNYIGRTFNADYDQLFDNFERETVNGIVGTGLTSAESVGDVSITDYHLQSNYSTTVGTTKDAPIYKVGSNANGQGSFQYLVIEMKGSNGASIEDLVLSFRYSDNYHDIDVNFSDLRDHEYGLLPDFDELAVLPTEDGYYKYLISPLNSIDMLNEGQGMDFTKIEGKEGADTIEPGYAYQAFHFMSKSTGEGAGTLDVKRIYWTNSVNPEFNTTDVTNYALLDEFIRTDLGEGADHVWWRGGGEGSSIVGKWLTLDATNAPVSYTTVGNDVTNVDSTFENFVLRLKGAEGGEDLTVTPVYANDVFGTPLALSEVKGPNDEGLPALTTQFQNLVVNFDANGWNKDVVGFKLESSTGLVFVDQLFFTNLEFTPEVVATEYPVLDASDLVVFDDFNRSEVGATPSYVADTPIATENDLLYIIGYQGTANLSIEDGALVMDATNGDLVQYTSAGTNVNDGSYKYVVFKVKGDEAASLNNFRFATIDDGDKTSSHVWANGGLFSAPGLVTPQFGDTDYSYVTEDGYTYVIVDLAESNLDSVVNGFDIFYGGAGKLYIDSIFFANEGAFELDTDNEVVFDDFNRSKLDDTEAAGKYWFDTNATVVDNALLLDATDSAYAYYKTAGAINNADTSKQYLVLTMKGSEGTTLDSFRMGMVAGTSTDAERFYNAGHIVGPQTPVLSTEYQTYIIDLEASGLTQAAEGILLSFGSWAAGQLYIDNISFADSKDVLSLVEAKLIELATEVEEPTDEEPTDETEEPTDEEPTDETEEPTTETPVVEDGEESNNLSAGVIAAIVAGIIVVGGAVVLVLRKKN